MVRNKNNFDSKTGGYLPLIIPIAFSLVVILAAGRIFVPLVLATGMGLALKRYFQKQKQNLNRLNTIFYQLIQENQGRVTALDLAMKAGVSGIDAQQYLDERVREFSPHFEVTDNGGMVYCFESAIFTAKNEAIKTAKNPTVTINISASEANPQNSESPRPAPEPQAPTQTVTAASFNHYLPEKKEIKLPKPSPKFPPEITTKPTSYPSFEISNNQATAPIPASMTQAELARRLRVHATTLSKWKTKSDFTEWSRSKDPAGISWEYDSKNKRFLPIGNG